MNELNPNLNKANKEVTMELNFIKAGDYYTVSYTHPA